VTTGRTVSRMDIRNSSDASPPAQFEDRSLRRIPDLETRHLSREVAGRVLVQDVSVQIIGWRDNSDIVGTSGAGKSIVPSGLLKSVLDEATSGTVCSKSQDYRSITPGGNLVGCRVAW